MEEKDTANGSIAILNGQFIVTDPDPGGISAKIHPPGETGIIFINDKIVQEPTAVTSNDSIVYKGLRQEEPPRIIVELTPDEMQCYITILMGKIIGFRLADTPATEQLKPVLKPQYLDVIKPTPSDVEQELTKTFIKHGINESLLAITVESANGRRTLIAEGTAPIPGKDGYVEYMMDIEPKKIEYAETEKVDYREMYLYPEVYADDLIAVIHPPVEGIDGLTVTGQTVTPKPVKEAKYSLKGSVETQGSNIVATQTGRLSVKYNVIEVTNILVHREDVTLKTGNIKFNGDIRISGDVNEDMSVAAMLNLTIKGNIYGALIQSGHDAELMGSVVKSDIQAGIYRMKYHEMLISYKEIQHKYSNFLKQYYKKKYNNFILTKGYIKQLIDDEHLNIAHLINHVNQTINNNHYFSNNKSTGLISMRTNIINMQNLLEIKNIKPATIPLVEEELKSIIEYLNEMKQDIPNLKCKNIQSSNITCGGHISIHGSGVYHSTIKSLGDVNIAGFFRGGSIVAGGNISVNELSIIQVNANEPAIIVPEGSTINVNRVIEPLAVQIGDSIHTLKEGPSGLVS